MVKKDTTIVYKSGTTMIETEAKAGQIVVEFMGYSAKNKIIIVDSLDWVNNIEAARKEEQELKEKWAAEKSKCDELRR